MTLHVNEKICKSIFLPEEKNTHLRNREHSSIFRVKLRAKKRGGGEYELLFCATKTVTINQ